MFLLASKILFISVPPFKNQRFKFLYLNSLNLVNHNVAETSKLSPAIYFTIKNPLQKSKGFTIKQTSKITRLWAHQHPFHLPAV